MSDPIETADLRACLAMARATMESRTRVGRILGEPGTGKTEATHYLAHQIPQAVRICCRRGLSEHALARRVAEGLGVENPHGSTDAILDVCERHADGRLIILDEANHLRWQHMERLRYLSDESGAAILLIGTDLLHRTFQDGRNAVYLAQLARRIGTKQVVLSRMDAKQTAAYVLMPRFGPVKHETGKEFHQHAKGYWGEAAELADGCQRIMSANAISELSPPVIQAAVRWLAERRAS